MIEYDAMKDEEKLSKHGLPLEFAILLFDAPYIEEEDDRRDYGEARFVATGPIGSFGNRIFVVIYTGLGGLRRIISFRKANDEEIQRYRARHP